MEWLYYGCGWGGQGRQRGGDSPLSKILMKKSVNLFLHDSRYQKYSELQTVSENSDHTEIML